MIKRNNPDNKNKDELAIELINIREKQIKQFESDIKNINKIKDKLIDLKIDVNQKEGLFSQLNLRLKILYLSNDLIKYGLSGEFLNQLNEESIKDIDKNLSKSERAEKSNEKLIKNIITEINKTVIKIQNEIKNWNKKRTKYKKLYKIK